MKKEWIQEDFKIEDIKIGMEFLNHETKQLSRVTNLTANSVEMFNTANQKSRYKTGQLDASGEAQVARLKGFDCLQWYTVQDFNRTFQKVDVTQYKFKVLKEWLNECIGKQKWTRLVF